MSRLIFSSPTLTVVFLINAMTANAQIQASGVVTSSPPGESSQSAKNPEASTSIQSILRNKNFLYLASKLGTTSEVAQKFMVTNGTDILTKLKSASNKEFNRYNLSYNFDLDGNQLASSKLHLRADASYQVQIKPSFIDGEQIRQDIYKVSLGSHELRLGFQVELRFTFTRSFSGPTAKWDALKNFEFPFNKFWEKVPMNADDFKTKFKDGIAYGMKDGEMVRLEIFGKIGPNFSTEKIKNLSFFGAGVELYTEALFAIDAQKVDRKLFPDNHPRARLRILALKNSGSSRFSVGVGTSELLKNTHRLIRNIFSIGGSLSFLSSLRIREPLPIDSLMVDYLFRFENDDPRSRTLTSAENAVDEIYKNFSRFGFLDLIDPTIPTKEVSERLLAHASLAERYALEDVKANLGDSARVRHLFKGRLRTNLVKDEGNAEGTKFNRKNYQSGTMNSHVTSVDVYGNKNYYLLENSFSRDYGRSGFASRTQSERIDDYDFLMLSDENETVGPLLDVVTRTEIKESSMDPGRFAEIESSLIRSLPPSFAKAHAAKLLNFFPKQDQTNAHITYQFNYGEKALKAIGQQLSNDEITLNTYDYILNHSNRKKMYLPFDTGNAETGVPSYSEHIGPIAMQINIALGANTSNDNRLAAVQKLKREPIFQKWLMLEFFPSLIPDNGAEENMGLTIKFRSLEHQEKDENTRILPLKVGAARTSQVYETVLFLRSIINGFDSFDLRLEQSKGKDGNQFVIIQQLKNFKEDTNEELNPDDED